MRRSALLIAALVLSNGCSDYVLAPADKDLIALHEATRPFQDFQAATAAGWSAEITPCMADPAVGGMGFHYGNTRLIDGTVNVKEPELLLFEPDANGRMNLVAVEYIIPYTAHSRSDAPPVLFGREFKQNDAFQLWGLHVWVWKDNPNGTFADWNPSVSCAHAAATSVMTN